MSTVLDYQPPTIISAGDGQDAIAPTPPQPGLILNSFVPILLEINDYLVVDDDANQYHLSKPIADNDWKYVQDYARTVEALDIKVPDVHEQKTIADSTYARLMQRQGDDPLFPSFNRLRFMHEGKSRSQMSFLPLFLSPSLASITITHLTPDAAGALSYFLEYQATSLTHLTLHSFTLSHRLATSVSHCESLEYLDLAVKRTLSYLSIRCLLSLSRLTAFKLDVNVDVQYTARVNTELDTFEIPPFESPRHLTLGLAGPLQMMQDIIEATSNDLVHFFNIETREYVFSSLDFSTLLHNIASKQGGTLQNLTLVTPFMTVDPSADGIIATLNALGNLRNLDFRDILFTSLSSTLPMIISHWPHMQHLLLPVRQSGNATEVGVRLSDLKMIAQSCPNLRSLQALIIRPDQYFEAPGGISSCMLSHGLEILSVGMPQRTYYNDDHFTTALSHSIARYLFALFPDLATIQTHQSLCSPGWKAVDEDLKLLQEFCRKMDRVRQQGLDGADI